MNTATSMTSSYTNIKLQTNGCFSSMSIRRRIIWFTLVSALLLGCVTMSERVMQTLAGGHKNVPFIAHGGMAVYDDDAVPYLPRPNGVAAAYNGAQQDARRILPTVHQTSGNHLLDAQTRRWRASWRRLGFHIRTADNEQARRDIERIHRILNFPELLSVYDALETNTQRSDVWRYAILWLDGGIYADIDVVALPPLADLVHSNPKVGFVFAESLAVFDYMPRSLSTMLCTTFRTLGLTDLVRLPQRRNCVIIAPARCTLMLRTLGMIVEKFNVTRLQNSEPTRTLELTGPGIFTDAIDAVSTESDALAGVFQLIHRFNGMVYFNHIGIGTWKHNGNHIFGLQTHESNLMFLVLALSATCFLLCLVGCKRTRIWTRSPTQRPTRSDWHIL